MALCYLFLPVLHLGSQAKSIFYLLFGFCEMLHPVEFDLLSGLLVKLQGAIVVACRCVVCEYLLEVVVDFCEDASVTWVGL